MVGKLVEFIDDESGATAIEYGLMAAMIAVGLILAMNVFGGALSGLFNSVSSKSANAMGG